MRALHDFFAKSKLDKKIDADLALLAKVLLSHETDKNTIFLDSQAKPQLVYMLRILIAKIDGLSNKKQKQYYYDKDYFLQSMLDAIEQDKPSKDKLIPGVYNYLLSAENGTITMTSTGENKNKRLATGICQILTPTQPILEPLNQGTAASPLG